MWSVSREGAGAGKLAGFRLAGNDKQLALRRTVSVFYLVERQREKEITVGAAMS